MKSARVFKLLLLSFGFVVALSIYPAFAIPPSYETVLENGLRVIMIPDSRVEMAVCYVIVGAGMRHETPDINGATHLLEHMLFNGTTSRTQDELYAEADRLGAYNNAFTREDFTAFMILAPTRTFKDAVALQADMILNSTLPPEKFEKERGIVLEEINKDASDPYYDVESAWRRLLWAGTPYEMQVLGPKSVIEKVPREKVWNFYKKYYAPNNITILLIGDFEPAEMIRHIRKLYGSAVPSQIEEIRIKPEFNHWGTVEKRYFADIKPRLYFAIPADATFGEIRKIDIGRELTERLIRQAVIPLIEERIKKAVEKLVKQEVIVSVSEETHPEMGFIACSVESDEARVVEAIAESLPSVIRELGTEPVDEAWLERRKRQMLADEAKAYDNFLYYGMFRTYDIQSGTWELYRNFETRVKALSKEEVESYLSGLSAHNELVAMLALPYAEKSQGRASQTIEKKKVLANGLTLLVRSDEKSKVFGATILFRNRLLWEPKGKNGIAELLMRVYAQGPAGMTQDEFEAEMAELGLSIDFYDNPNIPMDDIYLAPHYSYIKAEGLDEAWRENLSLMAEILRNPKITEDALTKAKRELARVLEMKGAQPREIARKMFFEGFFGGGSLGNAIEGDQQQAQSVTAEELKDFAGLYASPKNLIVSIATSANADEVMRLAEELFAGFSGAEQTKQWSFNLNQPKDTEKVIGKEQAYIYFGYAVQGIDKADLPALDVLGSIISGQVAMVIREQRGLAYSIGAGFGNVEDIGWFSVAMGTDPKNVDTAKELIRKVLAEARDTPISIEEIQKVVNSTLARMEMRRITRKNQAFYRALEEHTREDYKKYVQRLEAMKPEEVELARKKYFTPEKGVFFVVR